MSVLKSNPEKKKERPDSTRRSFMWKLGAGMSAVAATALPGMARASSGNETSLRDKVNGLSKQVELLEDKNAIHNLYRTYEDLLHTGNFKEVVELFTNDSEVVFNGGVFKGKNKGVHRLYNEFFKNGYTCKKMEPAPGFELIDNQKQDRIEISRDHRTARAGFTYSIQIGTPMMPDSSLVKMARLQGEGIMKWWESGVYEFSCKKDMRNGSWKIKKLEYRIRARANYRPGKSCATPISVPFFSKTYPSDPAGPDKIITVA